MRPEIKIMTHIVAGYPSFNESKKIAAVMLDSGVSFLEIQLPFSDPVADGKTIMEANQKSLAQGIRTRDCFFLAESLAGQASETGAKILLMTYFNVAYKFGLERFCRRARKVGVYGLIIPDMPIDEESGEGYLALCQKFRLHPIQVISPITPRRRLKKITGVASGFVYCLARTGTTGVTDEVNPNLGKYLRQVRKEIKKIPLAVGFGISSRKQIDELYGQAEIAVIGSKILNLINESPRDQREKNLRKFLAALTGWTS